jgi:cytochrome oxidase Cu insertion factor (SCO1/SenC/PrrC family)
MRDWTAQPGDSRLVSAGWWMHIGGCCHLSGSAMARKVVTTTITITGVLAALALITAYVIGVWPFAGKLEQVAESQGEALVGGPFTLVDQTGGRVTDADFAGRSKLMFFGYTYCPDMCPLGLATMAAAYEQLSPEEQQRVVPIFVTVDPERDTVEAIADYVDLFHPAMVGLTGTLEETAATAKAYRVYYRKAESESATEYLVDHSTFTYLMDEENRYVTHFGHDAQPADLVEGIRRHLESAG